MPADVLLLTGAPLADSLVWNDTGLLKDFTERVARFSGVDIGESREPSLFISPASEHASWRILRLTAQHMSTGHSQLHGFIDEYQGRTSFLTTSELYSSGHDLIKSQQDQEQSFSPEAENGVLSQFYEQSFAVHADIASSQIPGPAPARDGPVSSCGLASATTSFIDTSSSLHSEITTVRRPSLPSCGHLSDLEDIPNAPYLLSIQPQTMTVNLVVGIISISSPREIKTRRGAKIDLIELLVGDETKSGFGINCWLSSSSKSDEGAIIAQENDLRRVLQCIRPQDVILLQNVALSCFRGKVYGQTLRKEMTKLHLLYRNRLDRSDTGGCYTLDDIDSTQDVHPQLTKTRQVREWVLRFVSAGPVKKGDRRDIKLAREDLPPDTQ